MQLVTERQMRALWRNLSRSKEETATTCLNPKGLAIFANRDTRSEFSPDMFCSIHILTTHKLSTFRTPTFKSVQVSLRELPQYTGPHVPVNQNSINYNNFHAMMEIAEERLLDMVMASAIGS